MKKPTDRIADIVSLSSVGTHRHHQLRGFSPFRTEITPSFFVDEKNDVVSDFALGVTMPIKDAADAIEILAAIKLDAGDMHSISIDEDSAMGYDVDLEISKADTIAALRWLVAMGVLSNGRDHGNGITSFKIVSGKPAWRELKRMTADSQFTV